VCIYLRISYKVYMCVCVHLRICTQTLPVSLYILPFKYAESTYVTYTHTESACVCKCLRIHAQVYMCLYVVAYMDIEFVCMCECLRVCPQSTCVCVYISVYIHRE